MPSLFGIDVKFSDGSYTWVNGWTVVADNLTVAASVGEALGGFHRALLYNTLKVVNARVYGWDTGPSTDFTIVDIDDFGVLSLSPDYLAPPQDCLWLNLIPATGRFGKKFLRGSLVNNEVTWNAGNIGYRTTPYVFGAVATAATDLLEEVDTLSASIRMGISAANPTGRVVSNIVANSKPAHVNTHHGWFNKSA